MKEAIEIITALNIKVKSQEKEIDRLLKLVAYLKEEINKKS